MKTTMWIAAAAVTLIIGTTHAEEASRNVVGFARVDLAPGHNLVAYNWNAGTEDGRVSVQELFNASRMNGGMSLGSSDNVLFWDEAQQRYVTVWLFDSDGRFPDFDGTWMKSDGSGPSDRSVGRGDAFWVVNRGEETVTQYLKGEAVQENKVERSIPEGYSLFGRAYTEVMAVNDMTWDGAKGGMSLGSSDNILFWDADAQRYVTIWLFDSEGRFPAFDGTWMKSDGSGPAENTFVAGVGAWYVRRGSDGFLWNDRLYPMGAD